MSFTLSTSALNEDREAAVQRETRRDKAIALFSPNEDGVSEWVPVELFEPSGLKWSRNGAARHGAYWDIRDIVWEKRTGKANAITHLRMNGWKEADSWDQSINGSVREHFAGIQICSLSLLKVPQEAREIDHRYGNKKHPDYIEMYKTENQKPEHFQLLFSVLNSAKRQVCKVCCDEKKRPEHPTLGFVEGDETHSERFPCSGCFLAEPERYRSFS